MTKPKKNNDLRVESTEKETACDCREQTEEVLRRLFDQAGYDGDGASHTARVNALKLIAEHLGMFEKKAKADADKKDKVVYDIRFDCDKKAGE